MTQHATSPAPQTASGFVLREKAEGGFALEGELTLDTLVGAIKRLRAAGAGADVSWDASLLRKLDTAGALALVRVKKANPSLRLVGLPNDQTSLLALIEKADGGEAPEKQPRNPFIGLVERLGHGACDAYAEARSSIGFFGQVIVFFLRNLRPLPRFRMGSLTRHIQETGIDAMPIVALVAFLISVVLAYQGAFQLRPLGAQAFTANLVVISVLREMGVLLTAIMVAGRSGSAFTAEIGVMKVNEEVDALSMIGIEPFDILVLPRLLALLITLPLLTFIADIVGLFGGYVTCAAVLDQSWQQYWEQARHAARGMHFWVGMVKAPVFALVIAMIGCRLGMQVSGSAESVGTYTTRSVVESCFAVLVADALFSILFSQIGW